MDATRLGFAAMMAAYTLLIAACGSKATTQVSDPGPNCYGSAVRNSYLVRWKSEVPSEYSKNKLAGSSQITQFSQMEKSEIESKILKKYSSQIESAEYEFLLKVDEDVAATPVLDASAAMAAAWGPGDIQVSEAWSAAGGRAGQGVVVAVIDTGVDLTHRYLAPIIYRNPREAPGNGADDDGNGYVDDITGYNFVDRNSSPFDSSGHGTHVAGIIAGQPGPNGFVGVAPAAKILPLKFLSQNGSGSTTNAIAAIRYARNNGAQVINASWGGSSCSTILKGEIQGATSAGVLFVGSAGNRGVDISNPNVTEWPAAFSMPGKLVVGAMNPAQVLSAFSNYGALVDLAAPGENILSTLPPENSQPDEQFGILSGTSMATPFVSGVAAILFSINPSATPTQVEDAILSTVTPGRYGVRSQGKVNALAAVQYFLSHQ